MQRISFVFLALLPCLLCPVSAPAQPTQPQQPSAQALPNATPSAPYLNCAQSEPLSTLAAVRDRLLACNLELKAAESNLAAAKASVLQAGQRPNPSFSVGAATISPGNVGGGYAWNKQVDYQARLDQLIERGDKLALRKLQAEANVDATRWTIADARRTLLQTTALAWIDWTSARQRVALSRQMLDLYQRTEDAAKKRLSAGDLAQSDVVRIQLDSARSQQDLTSAQADERAASRQLAQLLRLGNGSNASPLSAAPWEALDDPAFAGAEFERVDVRAARAQWEAMRVAQRLAQAQLTRDVSVGVAMDHYPRPTGTGNTFSLSASWPLFWWHQNQGDLARAQADVDQALANLDKTEQLGRSEAQLFRQAQRDAAERAQRARQSLDPLSQDLVSKAEFAYSKGAMSVMDLLDALRLRRQVQMDALAAQADFERADVRARAARVDAGLLKDPWYGRALPSDVNP